MAVTQVVSELGFEVGDLVGLLDQLGVGGPLADAGQGPADGVGAVGGNAGGDQGVDGFQVGGAEAGHDRDQRAVGRQGGGGHGPAGQADAGGALAGVTALAGDELQQPDLADVLEV